MNAIDLNRGGGMNAQPMLGRFCRWCGEPAVGTIVIEPPIYKTVTVTSPKTGELISAQQASRFAINADVCAEHRQISDHEAGTPMPNLRRRKAEGVDQLDIFGGRPDHKPGNAIKGTL